MKIPLNTLPGTELAAWLKSVGQPAYRSTQIFDWTYRKFADSPDEMKNLPADLKAELVKSFIFRQGRETRQEKAADGTNKLLLEFTDGACVECVIIPSVERFTFCLSSQIGCPVGCFFCASGTGGLVRNLDASEILDEFFVCCRKLGQLPDNIVFMGTGEPLMNYSNFMSALNIICGEKQVGMSPRRITVSTSGFVPGIMKFAKEGKPWNLAVSLHSPTDEGRARLIPDKHRYSIKEISDACRFYFNETGRIVTIEYTLVKGLNDSRDDALKLADIVSSCSAKVNLIPLNAVEKSGFSRPDRSKIAEFESTLTGKGVPVTVRIEKGDNINAACGQLRISHLKEDAQKNPGSENQEPGNL
ncbi:MAG TPA: 23S rRNA (adenine(2503)-C(2))-methyltransferase RlmN [Lentisphaeria bacterium]|nr:MAG: 23S rRNA (adenine(2503)-C(2))-methyltransferase [Lentisphaerae bacterium GWF2_50_93]HCE45207.1 23S rRNA (adenine(2503)-C(2))-methyltransferase RlmN [Lentisphaeria bacterium]